MNKAKEIRFTDSRGKALFSVPDGGFLRLFYGNGDDNFALCRYVDEAHLELSSGRGGDIYHICEFAERMEKNGATYEPKQEEQPPQKAPKHKDMER